MTLSAEDTHKDILGKDLTVGSPVAVPHHNSMILAKVLALTPKMVKLSRLDTESPSPYSRELKKYARECVLLEPSDVTFYILRNLG